MQFHTRSLALVLSLVLSAAASAQAPTFEYRWSGLVYEITVPDATHAWTVEDGGRIRRTSDAGLTWSFDVTPLPAEHILRGIYVLPDLSKGWAVGEDGMMLRNIDPEFDDCWSEFTPGSPVPDDAEFYDVFFADANDGWLLAEKGIWYTTDAGGSWTAATLLDDTGSPVNFDFPVDIELYAMDIKPGLCLHLCGCIGIGCSCPLTPNFGLACGEPGFVYRTTDGITWREVFDVRDLSCQDPPLLGPCADAEICTEGKPFEPWDIEISDHATDPLAIMVGGAGVNCGLIFASDDWGCSWTREPHNCEVNPGTCEGGGGTDDGWIEDYPPENLESYRTVYGVAIDPTDNSAIAAAYNGQHLRRVPGDPGTYWTDHSLFGDVWKTPYLGTVVFPMMAAEFTPTGSLGYITGFGGHVRTTTDGMTYTEEGSNPGDFRIRGADFVDDDRGTLTGQFNMLAETFDGGELWQPREYTINDPRLNAVAFETNLGLNGVAVGQKKGGKPIVKYTINGGTTWFDATLPASANRHLNAVAWDKGTDNETFWAVGNAGLILETVDGGENWTKITGPSGTGTFKIYSVAFGSGPTRAAIVGAMGGKGTAYTYIPSPPTWTDASPTDLITPDMTVLTGVDAIGGEAYAVGTRVVGPVVTGLVLKLDSNTRFEKLSGAPVVLLCTVGKNPSQTEPLNAVGLLSIDMGVHQVLVAGQCGVVHELASGTWTEHRSETSSHVRGIRVAPGLGRVYLIAFRDDNSQSCIVREHIELKRP